MPITNQPNLAALQAAIVQAITDSQSAVIANTDSKTAAVAQVVVDETDAAATALAGEIATKATETQAAVTAKGVIKSVQRGTALVTTSGHNTNITILAVNLDKAAIITNERSQKDDNNGFTGAQVVFVNSTTINVAAGYWGARVTWQVVEYE